MTASPLPGMDPYLEHPSLWPDVHNSVIAALRAQLGPKLRPAYYVRLEERTYLADPEGGLDFVGRPDLAAEPRSAPGPVGGEARPASTALTVEVPVPDRIRETYLVVHRTADRDVVTVLELLSPTNKVTAGEGRQRYEEKRRSVLGSRTHLVEVDLIRVGQPMRVFGAEEREADYRILISRGDRRPLGELHLFSVRDPIPRFRLPLRGDHEEPEVDLRAALDAVYAAGSFDLSIDYAADPVPPLKAADADWADALLREAGLRPPQ